MESNRMGERKSRVLKRCWSRSIPPSQFTRKPRTFASRVYNLILLLSLLGVTFLMLEYHCGSCRTEREMKHTMTKNIKDIAFNLSSMKNSCDYLETTITKFTEEIPNIERATKILEELTTSLENDEIPRDYENFLAPLNLFNIYSLKEQSTTDT